MDMVKGIQIKRFKWYRSLLIVTNRDHQTLGNILTTTKSSCSILNQVIFSIVAIIIPCGLWLRNLMLHFEPCIVPVILEDCDSDPITRNMQLSCKTMISRLTLFQTPVNPSSRFEISQKLVLGQWEAIQKSFNCNEWRPSNVGKYSNNNKK